MNYLELNLSSYPNLKPIYNKLREDLYQVEESKKGEPTLKVNNIYMHSKYDPVKEADRIIEILTKDKEELDIIIIYGAGLGYVARKLFEIFIQNNNSKLLPYIIYVEPDLKIFLTSLKYFNWSEILTNDHFKIYLESEKEVIGSFIQSIPTKRVRYYHHRPSYRINEEYFQRVQNYIEYVLDRKDTNVATFTRFQKLWSKNFINNLPNYINANTISKLINTAKDTTAIVIAGGPSIEKCREYLKKVKDDFIIIAVDTVYKYLIMNGITPDILVTVDPQFWNYKYLENENLKDCIIVTDSSVYHKIFNLAPNENFFIGSSIFPLVKYFDENNNNRGTLSAGGSVSVTAFDVARKLGSNKIILIGLDLSFPDRMTHFRGSFFEKNFLNFCGYFNTVESASYNYLAHTPLKKIPATNGEVFTDMKMAIFKNWFDREIPITEAEVILPNCGGAMLEGVKVIEVEDLPGSANNSKNTFINKIKTFSNNNDNKLDWKNISRKINLILDYTDDIKKNSKKIIDLISEDGNIKPESHQKIEELEKYFFTDIKRAEVLRIISSSAQDIILSIIENLKIDDDEKKSAWIKTRLLYKSIYNLTDFYNDNLIKILKIYT